MTHPVEVGGSSDPTACTLPMFGSKKSYIKIIYKNYIKQFKGCFPLLESIVDVVPL